MESSSSSSSYNIECTSFTPFRRGSFEGYATLYVGNWGIEIKSCQLYSKSGKRWINLPTFESVMEDGSKIYTPFLEFKKTKQKDEWVTQAKHAIDKWRENNEDPEITIAINEILEECKNYGK